MEDLRKRGNELFPTDPQAAASLYVEAMDLYTAMKDATEGDSVALKEEYTRCAGNALTCLFKVGQYDNCAALALKVLRVNPLLAKAYAFIGRCMLLGNFPSLPKRQRGVGALQYLCRAVYLLPSMAESIRPFVGEALDQMLAELTANGPEAVIADGSERSEGEEPSIEVREGDCGKSVMAVTRLPAYLAVSSTLHPFSVCSYDDVGGAGVCYKCGVACSAGRESGHSSKGGRRVCTRCELVGYCSAECEAQYRERHDKHECRLMQRLKGMRDSLQASHDQRQREEQGTDIVDDVDDFFTAAVHCITTLSGIRARSSGYKVVQHQLEGHAVEVSQNLGRLVRVMQELLDGEEERGEVARLIGVVRCNAIEVRDDSSMGVGQALHAASITSYFNHSCAPNCAIEGEAIVTTRVIDPGEELTVAYIPQLYWPTQLRRGELAERYFFYCRCVRCCQGDDEPFEAALTAMMRPKHVANIDKGCEGDDGGGRNSSSKRIAAVQALCASVRSKDVCDISRSDREALEGMLQKCCAELYPFHYLCHELRNTLTFVYAALGDPRSCLCSCLDEFLLWESIMPGAHPVKRLKLMNALQCRGDLTRDGDAGGCVTRISDSAGALALVPLLTKLAQLYCLSC